MGLNIVADENIPGVNQLFDHLGHVTLVEGRHISPEQVQQADILLVRSVSRVNAELLEGSNVRFVGTATIGTDHLDTGYLDTCGIAWASAAGSNADSVVDYVLSALCRLDGVLESLLAGADVGIIGMGNVGSRLYQRLSTLGISCKGYDPLIDQDSYPILMPLDDVLQCDVICCHAPLTIDGDHPSFHLLNKSRLDSLKSGAVLINAGRGGVVDNCALLEVLDQRQDLCVVLDVWENEPEIMLDLLKRIDLGSPHIAGYSFDGKLAGSKMIYEACCRMLGLPPHLQKPQTNSQLQLSVSEHDDVPAAMKEAVLACYDVARDDQNLRGRLLHGDPSDKGELFDQLRKQYPVRRDISCYTVNNAGQLSQAVINGLGALGFCF
jgi:erythronate-4-phosphate dehydrogenase